MSVKRTLCLVLSVLLFINFALTLCVSAARDPGVAPLWNCTGLVQFNLSFSNNNASIYTYISGSTKVNIDATIQLYQILSNGTWVAVGNPITHTVTNGQYLLVSDPIPNLAKGNYVATINATVSTSTTSDTLYFESYATN